MDVPFEIDSNCRQALHRLNAYLTTKHFVAALLRHFDPKLSVKVITDASRAIIGAGLMQKLTDRWHPVMYV